MFYGTQQYQTVGYNRLTEFSLASGIMKKHMRIGGYEKAVKEFLLAQKVQQQQIKRKQPSIQPKQSRQLQKQQGQAKTQNKQPETQQRQTRARNIQQDREKTQNKQPEAQERQTRARNIQQAQAKTQNKQPETQQRQTRARNIQPQKQQGQRKTQDKPKPEQKTPCEGFTYNLRARTNVKN